MIWRQGILLLVAIQFLTRIPVPSFRAFEPAWLDRATRFFPLVGLLVGAIAALVLWLSAGLWPRPIPAILAVAAGVAVTGAFHEDGLADTADGLGGGLTRERRLEIMKDSRIGTYGAIVLMMSIGLRIAALDQIEPGTAVATLIAVHGLSRLMPVLIIHLSRYAGDEAAAKVKPLATGAGGMDVVVAAMLAAIPAGLLLGWLTAGVAGIVGAAAAAIVAAQAWRLIGGYTGDVLGAGQQAAEVAMLLAIAALTAPR